MAQPSELHYQPSDDPALFAQLTAQTYQSERYWHELQQAGYELLQSHYRYESFADDFHSRIKSISSNLNRHRHQNFFGRLLWQNQFRASEFMSRWIEQKNAN